MGDFVVPVGAENCVTLCDLGITVDQVAADRASFLAAYAELEEPRPNVGDLIRLTAGRQQPAGRQSVVDLFDFDDDDARAVLQRIESLGPGEPPPRWARIGERADAWRGCGVARLLIDVAEGRDALLRAARLYQELGLPFGSFLLAAVTGSEQVAIVAAGQLSALLADQGQYADSLEGLPRYRVPDEGLIGWQYVNGAPAQQISILLAAVSHPEAANWSAEFIEALRNAPQARSAAPVGTTAQPIALWWTAGIDLAFLGRADGEARTAVRDQIIELAQAHGRQLRYAQLDSYHWPRVQADVDLIDLYLAGLVAISDRALGNSRQGPWSNEEFQSIMPPLARVSLTLGLQLSRYSPAGQAG